MTQDHERNTRLPSSRAFVLQFRADTQFETQNVAGRIEHVASGRAMHFQSTEEFLAFISRMLWEHGTPPQDDSI